VSETSSNPRKTPLVEIHEGHKARMVDFAGWYMPVTYTSIVDEHKLVRTKVGLFDVSHMGRYWFHGPDHIRFIDHLLTNNRASMSPGQIRYSLVLNEQGGIIDDVLVYAAGDKDTMLVVNAGNRDAMTDWINRHKQGFDVEFDDRSDNSAMIAMQGPNSAELLSRVSDLDTAVLKYYRFTRGTVFGEPDVLVSRTGYTGEDGFELVMSNALAGHFWKELLKAGEDLGAAPAGLGARDTLRLEAGMPLHGNEIDPTINPLEAGLDWAVKLKKEDFIGRDATLKLLQDGLTRRLVGLNVSGKRIPRHGQDLLQDGEVVGTICSGTKSPWLDEIIATAYVPASQVAVGTKYEVSFPSKAGKSGSNDQAAFVVPLPFYTRPGKR
jgi:aminomethyltransferase